MDRPRLYVDFNEMIEENLVLLSKEDEKIDSGGAVVKLTEGLRVYVYMDDIDENGKPDNLLAEGVAERNTRGGWSAAAKWCCRIDDSGIRRASDSE